jgi:hypothetical protein
MENKTANWNQYNHICEIMDLVSFRKFGNAFRKNIDPFFKAEYNLKSVGGLVADSFPWSEVASYIIGDSNYSMTTEQYINFCNSVKVKPLI